MDVNLEDVKDCQNGMRIDAPVMGLGRYTETERDDDTESNSQGRQKM